MNFIEKPFSQKDLAVKVRKALDRDFNPESG
jgi:FixJ family two-component response regulator